MKWGEYNKYKNTKVVIDGHTFDSKKEAKRYSELKLMQKAGIIKDLELQPKFLLQPKFKLNNKTERAIYYIADFRYRRGDKTIIEDVKGTRTEIFKLKRKLFLYKYVVGNSDIEFYEV